MILYKSQFLICIYDQQSINILIKVKMFITIILYISDNIHKVSHSRHSVAIKFYKNLRIYKNRDKSTPTAGHFVQQLSDRDGLIYSHEW